MVKRGVATVEVAVEAAKGVTVDRVVMVVVVKEVGVAAVVVKVSLSVGGVALVAVGVMVAGDTCCTIQGRWAPLEVDSTRLKVEVVEVRGGFHTFVADVQH